MTTKYPSAVQEIFIRDLLSEVECQPELHLDQDEGSLLAYLHLRDLFGLVLAAANEDPSFTSGLLDGIIHCYKAAMYACPLRHPADLYDETKSIWEMSKSERMNLRDIAVPTLAAEWLRMKYLELAADKKEDEVVRQDD